MNDKEFIDKLNSKNFEWEICPFCGKEYWDESIKTEVRPTAKVYFETDIAVIENLVKEIVGKNVEIIAEDELHNGYTPCHSMTAEDHSEDIEKFINGNRWSFMGLHSWIEHLIFLNKLPKGNYIVDHSW